jgi:hypothetical protein
MMEITKRKSLLLLWLCLTSTAPFIFFSWPHHPYKLLTFACLGVMTYLITAGQERKVFDIRIFSVILAQIGYYLIITFYHADVSNLNLCIQLISLFIIVSFIYRYIGFELFAKSYVYAILIMAIGGTIVFLLHLLIGITPLFEVSYSESGTSYFLWLTTTNVYFDLGNIRLIRYSGFFDEPGTFALYSMFAIILNRVYFNNRRMEIWLIVLTTFTFSLAFYFVMAIYFIFFYLKPSSIKYILLISLLVSGSYFYLEANKEDESLSKLYEFTFKRFELDDSGAGLAENNRADLSEHDRKLFFDNPFFGTGSTRVEVWGSNFYSVFAKYGIIGSLFYYAMLVYLLFLIVQLKTKKLIFYLKIVFIILINFYHRPEMSSVFAMLFFISLIFYVRVELSKQASIPFALKSISTL